MRGDIKWNHCPWGIWRPSCARIKKRAQAGYYLLRRHGFGGILADEMGLGKTAQVLAHLRALKQSSASRNAAPSLVVCPSSLVFNWEAEARKFTPELSVLAVHGADRRELVAKIPNSDLVITSYALLRRDAEHYRGLVVRHRGLGRSAAH
jgi:SNF2 family DNA or RNA helicase